MRTKFVNSIDEQKRIEILNSYNILDTQNEKEFDRLTELAAVICEVPIAAISLVDSDRQWFKSRVGIKDHETRRDISFCHFTIKNDFVLEVEDATMDDRFKNNPLVTDQPYVRFYAGYPLIDPAGYALGALCVLDIKAKKLNATQHIALFTLAKEVVSQIVARKERVDKNHFEELFIRSIDMVCIANFDGTFNKVNPAFTVVLGWSNKELLERPFIDFVHPGDKQKTKTEIAKLSSGVRTINFSNRFQTKSGEYRILNWVANPDLLKGNIYAIARDMTDIIESENQLLNAEKKFRDVFENSPDAIFIEDSSGNILDVNAAAVAIQGKQKDKLIGINIRDLVPKDKYVKVLTDYKKLFLGVVRFVRSYVWTESKGEIPVEVSGKKISYGNKSVLLIHVRDISERIKLEEERANTILEKSRLREELIKTTLKIQLDERNRIATEMHDELGAGLSKISILGHIIKKSYKDPSIVACNIEKVILSSHNIQKNISEIIWAMDPKNDTLENLVSYINYYSSEFLETSAIEFKILLPENISAILINGKTRRNIFLITKESLNNLVKHADAKLAIITIRVENGLFSLIICDNGNGFDTEKTQRFKNGLQNMKRRAADIGGRLDISSSYYTGTTVSLKVPLNMTLTEFKNDLPGKLITSVDQDFFHQSIPSEILQ